MPKNSKNENKTQSQCIGIANNPEQIDSTSSKFKLGKVYCNDVKTRFRAYKVVRKGDTFVLLNGCKIPQLEKLRMIERGFEFYEDVV